MTHVRCTDGPLDGAEFDVPFPTREGLRLTLPLVLDDPDTPLHVYIVHADGTATQPDD